MKMRISPKAFLFVTLLAIFSLILGGAASYLLFQKSTPEIKFAPIVKHADLPYRAMETYAASKKITLPADSTPFINSNCPALSSHWVAEENLKPGVKMDEAKWRNLDLSAAEGSALWLNQTAVSCGSTVEIHAARYSSNSTPLSDVPRIFAAWRIGYYKGAGAREIWRSQPIKLKKRDATTSKESTRYTEANWPVTTSFTVGNDWTPGFYLIISFSAFGQIENAAPLIVRSPVGSSKLVMMNSFLT